MALTGVYLNSFVPRSSSQPGHLGMPVAGEHGPRVRRELHEASLMAAHVPQLHVAVLRHGRERVVLVRAELHVADRLRVAEES